MKEKRRIEKSPKTDVSILTSRVEEVTFLNIIIIILDHWFVTSNQLGKNIDYLIKKQINY